MNITYYIGFSVLIIMVWHFMFSTKPRDFSLMQMIGVFVLGGAIGWFMDSMMVGLLMSIVLSLIFI
ncbi:hypothetical protein A3F34_01395 [Candidatus Roizmanbacteria bacterium RIFCSPHIGHO2_12_FULL_44_10]|uniref:Uncharacterized protein n=1 Tax=Candidatus Roizmanbacteria bacterium RIFCSPHIGHO2_12_FULL_44_10 TaxID=1802054 RepID=A0A1F7I6M2_9BACT|nr:MAG: hypothetical protein A3F34_01395 [Candidatus Roizmanbacteria bacterium RIFCSPHIGHO2_12_FULL_44_10]